MTEGLLVTNGDTAKTVYKREIGVDDRSLLVYRSGD